MFYEFSQHQKCAVQNCDKIGKLNLNKIKMTFQLKPTHSNKVCVSHYQRSYREYRKLNFGGIVLIFIEVFTIGYKIFPKSSQK